MNNQPTVQDQINGLKKSHQDSLMKKVACETQLTTARNNLGTITQQIEARGLKPEQLPAKLTELQTTIQEKLKEAAGLLPATVQ